MKELLARLLAERLVNVGAELVDEGLAEIADASDDADAEGLQRWEDMEDGERDFFTKAMTRLLEETFLAGAVTVTQGDSLLIVVNDPDLDYEGANEICARIRGMFDGVEVRVLATGAGVSVIKGQQPLCGTRIEHPVWNSNDQELNEQAQAPCVLRGDHKDYPHKNRFGVEWVVKDSTGSGNTRGVFNEQNGSEHGEAYVREQG